MGDFKIVMIGAGSYVFGPGALASALLEHRMDRAEIALVDVDRPVLDLMAGVGRRMARDAGLATRITAHTDRAAALDGASFVVCSAAPGLHSRYATDCRIVDELAPGLEVTEFGGIAGTSYSLRQIAFIAAVAADMQRLAPRAWLLNVANPLPRVCQAAHASGVPAAGFCSVSIAGYAFLWHLFHGRGIEYPFAEGQAAFDAVMAGLNHFSWIVELRDRATGRDLMGDLRARLAGGGSTGQAYLDEMARETGYLLTAGDSHVRDFLAPRPGPAAARHDIWHGNPAERELRLKLLADVGEGRAPADELLRHRSWEKPMDFVAAMACGKPAGFHALNLANRGQIPNLPRDVFVETPCAVGPGGPVPRTVTLPPEILPYCERTARVTDTIVRAGLSRSRCLVHEAIELDPTVVDKAAGLRAIDACLEAHADVIGKFE